MDARLIPVNAFIALAASRPSSWPNTLFQVGYALEGLETPVTTDSGRIVIDAVAFDVRTNRFLVAEGKSGNNVEEEQARRYGEVDPAGLVRLIGVTIREPGPLTCSPIYVCLEGSESRILTGLAAAECDYPVLSVGPTYVTMHGGLPSDPALAEAFAEPVPVPGPPPALILVDDQSDDDEFTPLVAAAIVAEVTRGADTISCPSIAERAIPYLGLFAAGHRGTLVRAVTRAARRFCEGSPETFEFRDSTQTRDFAVVKVVDNPERADPRGRTQRYQAIKSHLTGVAPDEPATSQGSLFDDVDLAAELDKADTGEPGSDDDGEGEP